MSATRSLPQLPLSICRYWSYYSYTGGSSRRQGKGSGDGWQRRQDLREQARAPSGIQPLAESLRGPQVRFRLTVRSCAGHELARRGCRWDGMLTMRMCSLLLINIIPVSQIKADLKSFTFCVTVDVNTFTPCYKWWALFCITLHWNDCDIGTNGVFAYSSDTQFFLSWRSPENIFSYSEKALHMKTFTGHRELIEGRAI